ncbi:Las1-like-domain-containing protein [Amylocarpus encephaloides]|uniref:Las1-like-domain-containing protein n=1 Tax=Amylocarpus encephaloides TaxID=45428 RepID=A0A9P7YPU0_9HELO|nr:Las1-like-domain-containing protein [Amylocarpus encephaloides]
MVQYVLTPWRHHAELLAVRGALYGTEAPARREAVERVGVWMQRGNCPHLVESTALLVSAVLNDRRGGNERFCVRAAYGGAFSRFVTGLLDSHQTRQKKIPMYTLAKTLGLPATYVELRHQATHEELPSLPKLRTATEKALGWIWEYYWVKLSQSDSNMDGDTMEVILEALVKRIVREGDTSRRDELQEELLREKATGRWSEDDILLAIASARLGCKDLAILQRGRELQQSLPRDSAPLTKGSKRVEEAQGSPMSKQDPMRAPMKELEGVLDEEESGAESAMGNIEMPGETPKSTEKGWALWEGDWIPKPIGVV